MKLSDLRSCDGCGGPLIFPTSGRWFHIARISGAIVTDSAIEIMRSAASQGVPLEQLEGAQCPGAVVVLRDELTVELLICVLCYHRRPIGEIMRRYRERGEPQAAQGQAS